MGVSIRQKNGDWYIFVRHAGERAAQKCVDQEHAEDVQKAVIQAISAGQFDIAKLQHRREERNEATTTTLSEFFDKTMSAFWKASLAPATFSRHEVSFRLHIRPVLGDVPLSEITHARVKDWIVSLLQKTAAKRSHGEKRRAEEKERKLSKDSIRNALAALRAMLEEAKDRNLIAANPAFGRKLGKVYANAAKIHEEADPFMAEEIPLLLAATHTHFGYQNYVMMLTLFHTGVRASELAGLQWRDFDKRGRLLHVRRQYKNGKITRTKTKKVRKVDVSDVLLHELEALRKQRQAEYLERGKNEIPDWIFLSPGLRLKEGKRAEGEPIDMKNFYHRVWLKACDRAGIRRRNIHAARHTFATVLIMNSESLAYVKEQLGHSSIKVTVDIYGHWIPGSNRQAVNKIPSLASSQVIQNLRAVSGNT